MRRTRYHGHSQLYIEFRARRYTVATRATPLLLEGGVQSFTEHGSVTATLPPGRTAVTRVPAPSQQHGHFQPNILLPLQQTKQGIFSEHSRFWDSERLKGFLGFNLICFLSTCVYARFRESPP